MTASSSVVSVRVSDAEPFRSFAAGVSEAWRRLEPLSPAELDALPATVREGIAGLRQAVRELVGVDPPRKPAEPGRYQGVIAIDWPAPAGTGAYACMVGRSVTVTDAVTGKLVTTCTGADITVHADANALVTAALTLWADEEGSPVLDGEPVFKDGEILTGVFPFLVGEMKVSGS